MILSTAALRVQPALFFVVFILMAFGAYSYFNLPAREDPAITIRQAVVTTAYPGLSAERVELLITKPLEEAIYALPNVKEVKSTSQEGLSVIKPEFTFGTPNLEIAFDQLAETVTETQPRLPDGTRPSQVNDDFGDIAVITLAINGEDYGNDELADYAQHVRDRLITVDGTKKIDLLAARPERVFVEYENAILSQAGIAPSQIVAALQQQNVIRPGGAVDVGDTAFQLRPSGDFQSLADIENALVQAENGTMVRVGDIVSVSHGYEDPPRQIAYFNGRESVILAVAMEDGLSVLTYVERARVRVDEIRETLPVGLNLDIMTNEAPKVESAVYGVTRNMIQTLAIVLGIVILFLGVRTGIIVGSIVPAVILATFAIMGLFDIPLQRMSLATIIISLGLLVDNGIVIAEDFKRRVVELGDRDEALRQTSSELSWPLLSSSLTTIVVFLPLLINATSSTEYTRTITLVIMITLIVSWLFAMTVTTTLCHRFLKAPDSPGPEDGKPSEEQEGVTIINRAFDRLTDLYERFLRFILGIRWWYLAAMFGLFFAGNVISEQVPAEFFPSNDNPQVLVYVELPSGATTRATDEKMRDMIALVQDKDRFEGVADIAAYTGFGGPRFVLSLAPVDPAPNKGFMIVNAESLEMTDALVPALRSAFLTEFPGVNTRVTRMFLGPEDPAVIQVQVTGPDADYLNDKAEEVMAMLAGTDGMIDIWSNWRGRTPILDIEIRQDTARAAGVSSADIAASLARHIDGEPVTMFRDGDEIYPVTMRAAQSERTSVDALSGIAVYPSGGGRSVPLGAVADIRMNGGWGFIQREDMERVVQVEGRNLKTSPEDLVPVLQPKIDELNAGIAPGH
ncbi:MAG: efflux RND transporter permease subunit, partial [Pacificimonas sp.]